jgi:hypothetical protein
VGIAGCRWFLPIDGTTNSSAAGQTARQVGITGIAIDSYFAIGFGCEVTLFTTEWNKAAKAREENLWSVLLFF